MIKHNKLELLLCNSIPMVIIKIGIQIHMFKFQIFVIYVAMTGKDNHIKTQNINQ